MSKMYSIVIPVYNAQEYLRECLESCIKQLNDSVEVVCVNDGSKDSSGTILDEYALLYPSIKVIHKQNEGVSVARNVGIKHASGKYIVFLDSDDVLAKHCLEMLDKVLENKEYDIVIGRLRESFFGSNQTIHNLKNMRNGMSLEEARTEFISAKDNLGIWAVWRHVFRRSFIVENDLQFNASYSFAEDMDFIIQALSCMKRYTLIDFPLVSYRISDDSVSGQYTLKSALSHVSVISYWREFYKDDKKIVSYFANKQLAMLPHLSHLSQVDLEEYFKVYEEKSRYLNKATGKFKLVYILAKIVGYRAVSKLLG